MVPDWLKNKEAVMSFVERRVDGVDADEVEALVVASSAETCGEEPITVYRPWFVIAALVQSTTNGYRRVRSAAGSEVEYRDNADAVNGFIRTQSGFDKLLCNVPEGFEAVPYEGFGTMQMERTYG